jgi:hypothetical protein
VKAHPEVAFVGLNVADTPADARRFLRRYGWTWPQLRDTGRERARSLGGEYQPYVALIDEEGRLVATFDGGGTHDDWEALLEQL